MGGKSRTYGIATTLRQRIRERRAALGLTQEQLCERAQISIDAVSRIESGLRVPSLPTIERLARALNMSVAALIADKDPLPSKRPELERITHLLADAPSEVVVGAESIIRAFIGAVDDVAKARQEISSK
tara:strand:- start:11838 stop:12224 length:387 start_codon:yes stop_codon:yes gene_type:complete